MKFVFIAKHRTIWPVAWLCEAMGVSRSGFHAWLNRSPSARSRSDETVGQQVKASFLTSDRTYGARRVWRDLLADGVECGLHRIERLMRLQALRARPRRRRLPKDEGDRQVANVPANLLDRQFAAERRNQKWIADFTYIWTAEGWLYVSAVIDLFSRRVVGWSMSASMTAQLVADALLMAVWRRGKPDALMHHSDRGSQGGFNRSSQQWVYLCSIRKRSRTSTGVFQPSVLRGLVFRAWATARRSLAVCRLRSVPLGKYCLSKPLVFSFEPRCQGLCGSQK